MAALNRPTNATYETHENVTIDTQDNEDHTFCGIMFPIKCKDLLPVDHLVVKSVAVRGELGPLTVWVSKVDANYDSDRNQRHSARSTRSGLSRHVRDREEGDLSEPEHKIPLHPKAWTKVYDKEHKGCPRGQYTELVFDEPVYLRPGEMRALYIHSTLPGDKAIVYDNSYYGSSEKRFEDDKLSILTGRAHISTTCFGQDPIWGWGNAWRDRREFVGRLAYGTVYKLWNPEVQPKFGNCFQDGARALFLCQRRWESPFSSLPDEAIFYILNMCRWDWFHDSTSTMKDRRKREKERLASKRQKREQEAMALAASLARYEDEKKDSKPSAKGVTCARSRCNQSLASSVVEDDSKMAAVNGKEEEDEEDVDMSGDSDDDGDDDNDDDDMEDTAVNSDDTAISDDDNSGFESEDSDEDDSYHRANRRYFSFQYPDSDEEEEETQRPTMNLAKNDWFRHQFARVQVLRALAAMEDQAIGEF